VKENDQKVDRLNQAKKWRSEAKSAKRSFAHESFSYEILPPTRDLITG